MEEPVRDDSTDLVAAPLVRVLVVLEDVVRRREAVQRRERRRA